MLTITTRGLKRMGAMVLVLFGVATVAASPAIASPPPSPSATPTPDPNSDVDAARKKLAEAQKKTAAAKATADADAIALASAQARLATLQAKVVALEAEVGRDQAQLAALRLQIARDKSQLAAFIRGSYESGGRDALIAYVFSASTISTAMQRTAEVSSITSAGQRLLDRISAEEAQAQQVLAAASAAKVGADAAKAQMATQTAIIADAATQSSLDLVQAAGDAAQIQQQLNVAVKEAKAFDAAAQLLAEARAHGTIFAPIDGPVFTVDTDLTKPSGENVDTLNGYLKGTALEGLGQSFVNAEKAYKVSARYLVAHAIEESSWGTSDVARDKHNLFGYGADDSDPYNHAMAFASFDACIQFVAKAVATDYLTPSGKFYHGPTLHGMNVNYASDPYWSQKIARIARTIPLPPASP